MKNTQKINAVTKTIYVILLVTIIAVACSSFAACTDNNKYKGTYVAELSFSAIGREYEGKFTLTLDGKEWEGTDDNDGNLRFFDLIGIFSSKYTVKGDKITLYWIDPTFKNERIFKEGKVVDGGFIFQFEDQEVFFQKTN